MRVGAGSVDGRGIADPAISAMGRAGGVAATAGGDTSGRWGLAEDAIEGVTGGVVEGVITAAAAVVGAVAGAAAESSDAFVGCSFDGEKDGADASVGASPQPLDVAIAATAAPLLAVPTCRVTNAF
jgi:hypothetical protein